MSQTYDPTTGPTSSAIPFGSYGTTGPAADDDRDTTDIELVWQLADQRGEEIQRLRAERDALLDLAEKAREWHRNPYSFVAQDVLHVAVDALVQPTEGVKYQRCEDPDCPARGHLVHAAVPTEGAQP